METSANSGNWLDFLSSSYFERSLKFLDRCNSHVYDFWLVRLLLTLCFVCVRVFDLRTGQLQEGFEKYTRVRQRLVLPLKYVDIFPISDDISKILVFVPEEKTFSCGTAVILTYFPSLRWIFFSFFFITSEVKTLHYYRLQCNCCGRLSCMVSQCCRFSTAPRQPTFFSRQAKIC